VKPFQKIGSFFPLYVSWSPSSSLLSFGFDALMMFLGSRGAAKKTGRFTEKDLKVQKLRQMFSFA
jgi:hypothetical protein